MEFFIDTANVDEIREANDMGIICASTRHPLHITECAKAGGDIATVPFKVLMQMVKHPLTDEGILKFKADYEVVFGK